MKTPKDARLVICRFAGTPKGYTVANAAIRRVGMVHEGVLRLWCSPNPNHRWVAKKRALDEFEIIRDATPREVALGMALS